MSKYPTLVDKIYELESNLSNEVFLRQPHGDEWQEFTYSEVINEARRLVAGMKAAGLQKGDKIGIYSKNCYQWILSEVAIMIGGFVTVPFYANLVGDPLKEVIELSGIKMLFVGKLENWIDAKIAIPGSLPIVRFGHYEGSAKVDSGTEWSEFIKDKDPDQENFRPSLEDIWAIFFTSGTTGVPKGVVMPYAAPANIMLAQEAVHNNFNLSDPGKNKFFSYLPLNHIAEQALVVTGGLYNEGQISFAESLESFAKNLADVQPSVFLGIPRIWTKFQQGVLAKMPEKKLNFLLKIPGVSGLVKKKIRTALGLNDTKLIISGASALPAATSAWYQKLGIYIRETFGMTETMGVVLIQPKHDIRLGNSGRRLEEGQIKIDPETEEILVKNTWMFDGYYNEPELTKEAFEDDGFYKTGDTGTMDADGFVKVKGRVKDTFKTDKGEFIVPIPIEDKFANNNLIELLCLVGLHMPQPMGLIRLSEYCADMDPQEIQNSLKETLEKVNADLHRHEQIEKLICVSDEWGVENGMLTPTMKIKRNVIHEAYKDQFQAWFDAEETVIMQ
jgi:long-chain acyl-CoA synthetase